MHKAKSMNTQVIKNLSDNFFNNGPWIREVKSNLASNHGGRAEIENVKKMILTFAISALPLALSLFKCQCTFGIYISER